LKKTAKNLAIFKPNFGDHKILKKLKKKNSGREGLESPSNGTRHITWPAAKDIAEQSEMLCMF
jgi:hypothetical protein